MVILVIVLPTSFKRKHTFCRPQASIRHLSILQVAESLQKICVTDGRDAKQHILNSLLRGCQSKVEIRFLVRLLIRNMRIGANLKTVLAALTMAVISSSSESGSSKMDMKEAIALVQKTHDICPSIEKITFSLLEGGFEQMKRDCSLQVMIPIAPMLAHPIHAMEEIKKAMETDGEIAIMEWKYDGMRCQAHYDGHSFMLFSRHMLEITDQFPDVALYLLEAFQQQQIEKAEDVSFIIDAEIVGVEDGENGVNLLPFQDLSTRKKKNDDGNGIRVKIFAFDLMFCNGESCVNEPLWKRRTKLHEIFQETTNFAFVSSQDLPTFDESKINAFLTQSVENGAEGLMVKMLGKKTASKNDSESETQEHSEDQCYH